MLFQIAQKCFEMRDSRGQKTENHHWSQEEEYARNISKGPSKTILNLNNLAKMDSVNHLCLLCL